MHPTTESPSPAKPSHGKIATARKKRKLAAMITESDKKSKLTNDDNIPKAGVLHMNPADANTMRNKFKEESNLLMTLGTFNEQRDIFMNCIKYIVTMATS